MNLKKLLAVLLAVLMNCSAFAYMAVPPDDDPMQQFLQQYEQEMEKLNKQFDQKVLPPLKDILKIAQAQQNDLTLEQEKALDALANQLEEALTSLVEPAVDQMDIDQLNALVKQSNDQLEPITKESLSEMMKAIYLLQALAHFAQTNQISEEELEIASVLFFPQDEEDAQ